MMNMKIALAVLSLASVSFALDEYLPIGQAAWEIDVGYALTNATGNFDAKGSKQDPVGSPMSHTIPLQVKYGVANGLDIELYLPIVAQNSDMGGKGGIDRPELALKYARPEWTYGYFLNLVLPLGLADFSSNPAPGSAVSVGAVYDNRFTNDFRVVGMASFLYSIEAGNSKNQDVLTLYAKPEKIWNANVGTYCGLKYNLFSEGKFNGMAKGDEGYLLTVLPGINLKQDRHASYEMNIPLTVAGKNQPATWGISLSAYYSI